MAIRADRLLKLADYLETVPRGKFHMSAWTNRGTAFFYENGHAIPAPRPECGFAGCALGWAIHGRLFSDLVWSSNNYPRLRSKATMDGYDAAAHLFGITYGEAEEELFGPENVGTPKQVAKRIRRFVRDHAKAS